MSQRMFTKNLCSLRGIGFLFLLVAFFGNILVLLYQNSNVQIDDNNVLHNKRQQFTQNDLPLVGKSAKKSIPSSAIVPLPPPPPPPVKKKKHVFSICLITKDDVNILPEWIAYHYHAMNLRHLVVAVDPASKESPSDMFEDFRSTLPDLEIEEWADESYLPEFFLNGSYGLVPNFVTGGGKNGTFQEWDDANNLRPIIRSDFTTFNNHYYRQLRFVSQCTKHLLKYNRTFMSPLDSDEYIVINPLLKITKNKQQQDDASWNNMEPASVLRFLEDRIQKHPQLMSTGCLKVPRLLFGSVKNNDRAAAKILNPDSKFNISRFETLAWLYHGKWQHKYNHMQKVILDISKIPKNDTELLGEYAFSVHQPSTTLCPPESFNGEINDTLRHPLVGNHYLGSWERYNSRIDKRRSEKFYTKRQGVNFRKESGWLTQWLEKFVEDVGIEKASKLLKSYLL